MVIKPTFQILKDKVVSKGGKIVNINLINQTNHKINQDKIYRVILKFFLKNKIIGNFEVGIHIVDSKQICKLNKKYRHINKVTDVLSFPTNEKLANKLFNKMPVNNLGDIFLCPSCAKKKVKEKIINWTSLSSIDQKLIVDKEINFLINHGFKHLIGIHHKE